MAELTSSAPQASSDRWHAMGAGFLGWTLDAFDFFVVIFLFDTLAAHFHVPKRDIVLSVTATLAMRPVGALLFGMMADRYGRRRPLMVNVLFFSTIELLCGFAPNFTVFFILRMLFGIGMGGEWGVGASLAMEHAPVRWRGVLSGILQSGYPIGYLLAAFAARLVLPNWGWRAMFWVGGIPALLALYIRTKVPESEAWKLHRVAKHHRRPTHRLAASTAVAVPNRVDVPHELPLAWDAGPLSRLPEARARHSGEHCRVRHYVLQRGCSDGRCHLRSALGAPGTPL